MVTRRRLAWLAALLLAVLAGLFVQHHHFRERSQGEAAATGPASAAGVDGARAKRLRPLALRRFSLRGRVVDAAGQPVAGARVVATAPGGERLETDSGAAGEFRFDDRGGGHYVLAAEHDEHGASLPRRTLLDEQLAPVVLRLGPAATLSVRIVDARTRAPLAGADVVVRGTSAPDDPGLRAGRTGDDGAARFVALAPGSYEVTAAAAGHRTVSTPLPPQAGLRWEAELALLPGVEVRGRVVDDAGTPLAGALVEARPAELDLVFEARKRPGPLAAVSDHAGRFTLVLEPGSHALVGHHPSCLPGRAGPVEVGRVPPPDVMVTLARGASIEGLVVDAAGVPAAGATVRAAAVDLAVPGSAVQQTLADADGRFRLAGLPRARVVLVAALPDASSDDVPFDLAATAEVRGARIELGLDGRVEGTVVDGEGAPIPGAQVVCVGNPRAAVGIRPIAPETTDEEGRFVCAGLPDDDFELTAMRPLPNNAISPWMRSSGATARTGDRDVKIVIPDDGAVAGRVRIGGRPAREFGLQLDDGGAPLPVRADDGRFRVDGLAPRRYDLRVVAIGARPRLLEGVVVPEGGTLDLGEIDLEAL